MRRIISVLIILVVTCLQVPVVSSQELQTTSPEAVGLSSERLARIAPAVERWIAEDRFAGAVTLVARHGKIAHFGAYGMADREDKKLMRTDAIFRIMSMTKVVTSVAVMMLYEEGLFLLDDPISAFIPEFKNPKVIVPATLEIPEHLVPAKREITIRDLLNHSAGLSYGGGLNAKYYQEAGIRELGAPEHTIEEFTRALGTMPLLFHPGEDFQYSYCDDVLGYLIELVSGKLFDRFFEERIFTPLKMVDTFFYVPAGKMDRLSALYMPGSNGTLDKKSPTPNDIARPDERKHFSGGGGLYSTVADYARLCQMLLNGGKLDGVRLLSRKTVEAMTTNSIGPLEGKVSEGGDKWGLGSVSVCTERKHVTGVISQGAYMKSGAYSTYFWIDPKEDMLGIFMTQTSYGMEIPNMFSTIAATSIVD